VLEISVFGRTDFFMLQSLHEALALGVIPWIAQSTHAGDHSVLVHDLAIFRRSVLNSPIGMMNEAWCGLSVRDCLLKSIDRKLRGQRSIQCPSHDLPGKGIFSVRTNGVPGVFSVDNQLRVEEEPK
jgi:hypothetical protein